MEYTTLRNGVRMPMLGYGTFQIPAGGHQTLRAGGSLCGLPQH